MHQPVRDFTPVFGSPRSAAGWEEIHYKTGIFVGGTGVVVLSCRETEIGQIVAAAFSTLPFIWSTETNQSLLASVSVVASPGSKSDGIAKEVFQPLPKTMKSAGGSDHLVTHALSMFRIRTTATQSVAD